MLPALFFLVDFALAVRLDKVMDSYTFNKVTGIYSLNLRCVWQHDSFTESFLVFNTAMGSISMTLKRNFGRADFLIKAHGSNGSYLTAFKSCTARMPNENYLYFGAVNFQNSSRLQFGTHI